MNPHVLHLDSKSEWAFSYLICKPIITVNGFDLIYINSFVSIAFGSLKKVVVRQSKNEWKPNERNLTNLQYANITRNQLCSL